MSILDTTKMKVEEIREYIISTHGVARDTLLNIKGKSNLVNFLNSLTIVEQDQKVDPSTDIILSDDFDEPSSNKGGDGPLVDIDEFEVAFANPKNESTGEVPNQSDSNWTEYVLSQLTDIEKDKEYPKADGLRRLVEKLISPIVSMQTTVIQAPQQSNMMTSTVKTTVTLENGQSYEAVTDVQKDHLQHPFDKHISAIAETRAEGRAYRKILRLQNIVTKEEMVADTNLDDSKMNRTQIQFLDVMCGNSRLNINVKKLFETVIPKKLTDIKQHTNEDVQTVFGILSGYQEDMSKIPAEIRGYTPSWKD